MHDSGLVSSPALTFHLGTSLFYDFLMQLDSTISCTRGALTSVIKHFRKWPWGPNNSLPHIHFLFWSQNCADVLKWLGTLREASRSSYLLPLTFDTLTLSTSVRRQIEESSFSRCLSIDWCLILHAEASIPTPTSRSTGTYIISTSSQDPCASTSGQPINFTPGMLLKMVVCTKQPRQEHLD